MRIFFNISYRGTAFNGWQRQLNTNNTVQQIIEEKMGLVLKTKAIISGCGRTDAGVHANEFFFHMDLDFEPDTDFIYKLNTMLPEDIVFNYSQLVHENANARFDAVSRTYKYCFHFEKNPMLSGLSTLIESPLDFEKIRKSLDLLGSFNNYRSFCKSPEKHKSTICQIYNTELVVDSDSKGFKMYFTANRFLRGMIRILSNQLILIGKNQLSFEKFHELLEVAPTEFNLKSMYPDGLYLDKVNYEFIQSN